jgi:hypothetical protein
MSRKFALIIGNSEYNDKSLACLKTPAADVRALAEVLLDSNRGGFDEAQTLINEPDSTIRKAIERFFARKKSDDLLLLYFSGHGVLDDQGRLYLACQDTEYELWSASAIPASFITDSMDRSQSRRQVLILDCCHSGAFFRGTKAVTGDKAVTETTFEGKGYGKVVLTATDTTQYAWSDDQLIGETENSVFTHFLIEGLKTGGADTNNDGEITLDELYDYVYRNLVSATSKQTPRKWAYNQQGELIIATNPSPIIKPEPLPDGLLHALENTSSNVREGAVRDLEQLLKGRNKGLALTAREALEHIAANDDSRKVSTFASEILKRNAEVTPPVPSSELKLDTVVQENLKAASERAEKEKEQAKKEKEAELKRREEEEERREREEEQKRTRIAALDNEADAAIAKKDWSEAVDKLQALLVLNPGHREAAARLKDVLREIEEAKRQQKIANLEREVEEEESREDWAAAIKKLRELSVLVPDHPQALDKIESARRHQESATYYTEGQTYYAARNWHWALRRFEQVKDLNPDYKDVSTLIADVKSKIAEEAKPEPPTPTDPPPTEPPTGASSAPLKPGSQREAFMSFTPVGQERKLWPLAVGAGIVLAIVIGIVVYNSSGNNPTSFPSSFPSTSPSASPSSTPLTDIRKVDFSKLTFSVFDDKYKTPQSRNDYFPYTTIYGDLTGDGIDEAAIEVTQWDTNTYHEKVTQGFVYSMKDGKPILLDKFYCPTNGAMVEGRPANETHFIMDRMEIKERKLIIKCWEAGAYETTAEFHDVTTFEWNGSKLVQVGRTIRTSRY